MAFCPQCGADVADASFCSQCGADLNANNPSMNGATNPFEAGAQTQGGAYYDGDAPTIPGFMEAVKICWKKAFNCQGRASRSEYWFFTLWNFLTWIPFGFVDAGMMGTVIDPDGGGVKQDPSLAQSLVVIFYAIYGLALICPTINAQVRRLHDSGKSGWLWLIKVVPYVGSLILLFY